jgi:hypothetical protein
MIGACKQIKKQFELGHGLMRITFLWAYRFQALEQLFTKMHFAYMLGWIFSKELIS